MRIIISGGGTGGHIYPALSLLKEFKKRESDIEILYVGSKHGLEADIVQKEGIPFFPLKVSGFKRKISWENLRTVYRFINGVSICKSLIRKFKPDIVIGTGGYVCAPVVYAASKLSIPTLIHEQNVIPGLTNQFLSRYVDMVAVSFSGSEQYFPAKKVKLTGNPRATEVATAEAKQGFESLHILPEKKIVLVVGGSRGARPINETFLSMIPRLVELPDFHFVYVTGEVHYEKVVQRIGEHVPTNLSVYPFLYNMPEVLAATSLIINRAGASFLAEITALGLPSILIPSPYVTNNHQEKNARWMEEQGASIMLLEKDLNEMALFQAIHDLMNDETRLIHMSIKAKSLGKPEAAELLYKEAKAMLRA
ncbi:undecaprenyldiphospho-muramoylpentapeptide beta-N-acetylglucosaminyltransferase [Microaerobacter geothermalis]|uniref:undecaprenyldiphospho-muramoylpentapeptide beta-N-acetylglucosaminyltransferase n=1 Tax=Microaerobacter geothermalis TaxID=674972 RepID=UPI001F19F014|nr:undecaprenyldiphospho-muramoylpentapeptide beta-N-acetylglucosaminyltransferase [Microaerobacter geothermalis]MCF6093605.1 undecaprenyldiphospho-muramoylpentapeptide beta-N-acetylglucosaminyltransferase [Microaerobacter geothermalis]